jgi:hypothetical protein
MSASTLPADFALPPQLARELRYTVQERRALHAYSLVTLAVVYTALVVTSRLPWLSPFTFVLVTMGAVRYGGYIHALNHAYRNTDRVPWLLEILPAPSSPFLPGFSETRKIHLAHHKYETAEGDPDNFLISGSSRLLIFLKCAFVFEHWFIYSLRHGWVSDRFWRAWLCRLAIFAALFAVCGWQTTLLFSVGAHVGAGWSFYIFSYLTHIQEGKRGTYLLLSIPRPAAMISRLMVGPYAADPAALHAVHHALPWVSCAKLLRAFDPHQAKAPSAVEAAA